MKSTTIFQLAFLVWAFLMILNPVVRAELREPDSKHYPNPYTLLQDTLIQVKPRGDDWLVFANRKDAPIQDNPKGNVTGTTDFLEPFFVEEKKMTI